MKSRGVECVPRTLDIQLNDACNEIKPLFQSLQNYG